MHFEVGCSPNGVNVNEPHKRDAIASNGRGRRVIPSRLFRPIYNEYLMSTTGLVRCCDDIQA